MRLDFFSFAQLSFKSVGDLARLLTEKLTDAAVGSAACSPFQQSCFPGALTASASFEPSNRQLSTGLAVTHLRGSCDESSQLFDADKYPILLDSSAIYFTRFWGGEYTEQYISDLSRS